MSGRTRALGTKFNFIFLMKWSEIREILCAFDFWNKVLGLCCSLLEGAAKVLGQMFQLKFSRKVQIFLSIFLLELAA